MSSILIQKYQHQAPRYTSYPTVPYWDDALSLDSWKEIVHTQFNRVKNNREVSVYIHLPYCESLCTYCACNTRITVNHAVEKPYIAAVCKEWDLWLNILKEKPVLTEIHLGGGTPTFFSPENLSLLIQNIKSRSIVSDEASFSFEAHPNYTSKEHLQELYNLGFRRVSFGIQDFDPTVQVAINRIQTFETVQKCVEDARSIGYTSINFDLVYGLPFQTIHSIEGTVQKVTLLKPDRIAFYNYAHVPWIKPGQRKFTENDLPDVYEKSALFSRGKDLLIKFGYETIGMDHFAFPQDELYISYRKKKLFRNFMGYTQQNNPLLLGLGVSAISDAGEAYAQNYKVVEEYIKALKKDTLPFLRGHENNREDRVIRKHILNIMCFQKTSWGNLCTYFDAFEEVEVRLKELQSDGLIQIKDQSLVVTELGKNYLRNIAMAFDVRYWRNKPQTSIFSKAV